MRSVFARSALVLGALAALASVAAFFLPPEFQWLGFRIRIDGFEKPLVMAAILFGVVFLVPEVNRLRAEEERGVRASRIVPPWAIAAGIGVGLWFSGVNGVRHHQLLTGYDIGTYSNILFNTLHGRWFLESHAGASMLAEHTMFLSAPLALLFEVYESGAMLAVAESFAVALCIPFLAAAVIKRTGRESWALLAVVALVATPYFHRILLDPFRPIVLAMPFWFAMMWAFAAGRKGTFLVLGAVAALAQEHAGLFTAAVGFFLFCFERNWRRQGLLAVVIGLGAVAFMMAVVMPAFLGKERLVHMDLFFGRYPGNGLAEVLWNMAKNPLPLLHQFLAPEKVFQMLLLTGATAFVVWRDPRTAVLFLPLMLFYQLSDFSYMNRYSRHYSADPLAAVFFATVWILGRNHVSFQANWTRHRRTLGVFFALWVAAMAAQIPDYRVFSRNPDRVREVKQVVRMVPPGASVTASRDELYARLAFREKLKAWPVLDDPEYVAVTRSDLAGEPALAARLESAAYEKIHAGPALCLYRKRKP